MSNPTMTRLIPSAPRGIVLLLHGGAEHGEQPVTEKSLSWRRSRRMMGDIGGSLGEAGVGAALLAYRTKGWNAGSAALPGPVSDAGWALEQLGRSHPGVPIVLLGHSMGARAAVAVADRPEVVGVVALAPWWPEGEPVDPVAGSVLRAAHGRRDRITSPRASKRYVERASALGADATFTDMGRVGHYMLRGVPRWNDFASSHCLDLLARAGVRR